MIPGTSIGIRVGYFNYVRNSSKFTLNSSHFKPVNRLTRLALPSGTINKTYNFDFFSKTFFKPNETVRRVGHENRSLRSQNLTLDFEKIPEGPKMDRKLLNYLLSKNLTNSYLCQYWHCRPETVRCVLVLLPGAQQSCFTLSIVKNKTINIFISCKVLFFLVFSAWKYVRVGLNLPGAAEGLGNAETTPSLIHGPN